MGSIAPFSPIHLTNHILATQTTRPTSEHDVADSRLRAHFIPRDSEPRVVSPSIHKCVEGERYNSCNGLVYVNVGPEHLVVSISLNACVCVCVRELYR